MSIILPEPQKRAINIDNKFLVCYFEKKLLHMEISNRRFLVLAIAIVFIFLAGYLGGLNKTFLLNGEVNDVIPICTAIVCVIVGLGLLFIIVSKKSKAEIEKSVLKSEIEKIGE